MYCMAVSTAKVDYAFWLYLDLLHYFCCCSCSISTCSYINLLIFLTYYSQILPIVLLSIARKFPILLMLVLFQLCQQIL